MTTVNIPITMYRVETIVRGMNGTGTVRVSFTEAFALLPDEEKQSVKAAVQLLSAGDFHLSANGSLHLIRRDWLKEFIMTELVEAGDWTYDGGPVNELSVSYEKLE